MSKKQILQSAYHCVVELIQIPGDSLCLFLEFQTLHLVHFTFEETDFSSCITFSSDQSHSHPLSSLVIGRHEIAVSGTLLNVRYREGTWRVYQSNRKYILGVTINLSVIDHLKRGDKVERMCNAAKIVWGVLGSKMKKECNKYHLG